MILAFVGCTTPDSDGDRKGDETTPTETVDAWEPPEIACELEHPLPIRADALPYVSDLYGPEFLHFIAAEYAFDDYEDALGCPTHTTDPDLQVTTWTGSCDLPELTWEGTWASRDIFTGDREDAVFELAVRYEDRDFQRYAMTADGRVAFSGDDALDSGSFVRSGSFDIDGIYSGIEGLWELESSDAWTDTTYALDLRATRVPPGGEPEDYCIVAESEVQADCDAEPWGGWVIAGDVEMVATFDPDVACDGCANVTLDGVPSGLLCDPWTAASGY